MVGSFQRGPMDHSVKQRVRLRQSTQCAWLFLYPRVVCHAAKPQGHPHSGQFDLHGSKPRITIPTACYD